MKQKIMIISALVLLLVLVAFMVKFARHEVVRQLIVIWSAYAE